MLLGKKKTTESVPSEQPLQRTNTVKTTSVITSHRLILLNTFQIAWSVSHTKPMQMSCYCKTNSLLELTH